MTRTAILLRGVNVGQHKQISMDDLRGVLTDVGCRDVTTYLRSGNAVAQAEPAGLAPRIEAALRASLDLDVRVLVRTGRELAEVVSANPYPDLVATPKRLHAAFVDAQPDPAAVAAIGTRHGADEFSVGNAVLYLAFAGGSNDSPLNAALRRLGVVMTARNWTTVLKLASMTAPP